MSSPLGDPEQIRKLLTEEGIVESLDSSKQFIDRLKDIGLEHLTDNDDFLTTAFKALVGGEMLIVIDTEPTPFTKQKTIVFTQSNV